MSTKDPVEFRLYDTDLTTTLGILPSASMNLYLLLNEPGSGEVKIPLRSRAGGSVASGQFSQCRYRGGVRGGFFVENIGKDEANSGEREGQWMSLSGRGAMALLEDGIVWNDGTTATVREFSGTKAAALITLIDEAQARGALQTLSYDFSATLDSDGNAWDDDEPVKFNVGMTLLDVVRAIAKVGIDFDVTPGSGEFTLSAYKNGLGTDKSETVYFRVGVNCEEVSGLEAGGDIRNALHVKYKDGYLTVQDDTSISNRRRREGTLDASYAGNNDSAMTFGQAELETKKDPKHQISVKVYDGAGPRAFLDYAVGDWIMLDREGTETKYRIRGMQLSWDDGTFAGVTVDLNSIVLENEIRMAQDIEWLKDQWESARDAGLLQVKFWSSLLDADTCDPSTYQINDIEFLGNKMYVAGAFTRIGGVDTINAAVLDLDTMQWSDLGGGLTDTIYNNSAATCILVDGTDVYFGGSFRYAGGVECNGIAKWDTLTETWSVMTMGAYTGVNKPVQDMIMYGGVLYVTGWFDRNYGAGIANLGHLATWDGANWAQVSGGLSSYGQCLLVDGSDLYVGGQFIDASGVSGTLGIAKWNGSAFSSVGGGLYSGSVLAIAKFGTDIVIASGGFNFYAGQPTDIVAYWDGLDWSMFATSPFEYGAFNSPIGYALFATSTDLYLGGHFKKVDGSTDVMYIARWNKSNWSALAEGLSGNCNALYVKEGQVYAGGAFLTAGDKEAGKLAVYISTFQDLANHLDNRPEAQFDLARAIHNATAKTEMDDDDEIGIWDSISGLLRKITWTNILASIKTWADTIYLALTGQTANRVIVTDASGDVITSDKLVFRADDGAMDIGEAPPSTNPNILSQTAYSNIDGFPAGHQLFNFDDDDIYASFLTFIRSKGTPASPSGVTDGNVIGYIKGKTFDSTPAQTTTNVEVRLVADGDHSPTSHPTRIEFYTTPSGSTTRVLIATLTSDGKLNLESGGTYDIAGSPHTHTPADIGVREKLTANRTYYVRTDGSDSNDGLTNSSGGAFLTISKAITVCKSLDFAGYTVTIQVGSGTFSETVSPTEINGNVTIQGTLTALETVTSATVAAGSAGTQGTVTKTGAFSGDSYAGKLAYFVTNAVYRIIDSHTNDTLTLVGTAPSSTTQDVIIYDWSTIIDGGSSSALSASNLSISSLTLNNLRFDSTASSGVLGNNSGITLNRCEFRSTVVAQASQFTIQYCSTNTSVNNTVLAQLFGGMTVYGCRFVSSGATCVVAQRGGFINLRDGTIVQAGTTGINVIDGGRVLFTNSSSTGYCRVRNCTAGISAGTGGQATGTANNQYSGNTTNESATAASYGYID